MWQSIKRILTNRTGHALIIIHLCLVVYDFARKPIAEGDYGDCVSVSAWDVTGTLLAGRYVHFTYESTLLQLIVIADLPAVFIGELVSSGIFRVFPDTCIYTASWINAIAILTIASLQWALAGFVIERLLSFIIERLLRT